MFHVPTYSLGKIHLVFNICDFTKVNLLKFSTIPWSTDMADLGLMMIQMLSRSEKYLIKQYILTPLDLFNEINTV